MIKPNHIRHYIHEKGVRFTVADVTSAVEDMQKIHAWPLLYEVVLGKILAGTAVLATDFKNHEGISISWTTQSPFGVIRTDAYEGRYVRGYIEGEKEAISVPPEVERQWLTGKDARLKVTRYSLLKQPYTSTISLQEGTIAECFEQYKKQSDQVMCHTEMEAVIEHDKLKRIWSAMYELLPGGDIDFFEEITKHSFSLHIERKGFDLLFESPIAFRCTCSEERIRNTLLGLPQEEKEKLLKEPYGELICHCCGKVYKIPNHVMKKWFMC